MSSSGLDGVGGLGADAGRLSAGHPFATHRPLQDRQVVVAFGQLLNGLAVGDVADEQTQLIQGGDVLGNGLEAGQEEIADGEVGADAIGQEVVDFGSQLPTAVVYDVVGHLYSHQKLAPPPLERARGKKEFNRSSRSIKTSRPKQCVTHGTIRKL